MPPLIVLPCLADSPWSAYMLDIPEDANPTSRAGNRNLECPYYILCLDVAAANLWVDFTCDFCLYRKTKQDTHIEELDLCAPGWEDIWGGGS